MVIRVKYIDGNTMEYNTIDELIQDSDNEKVISIDCSFNKLVSLPNMIFPNLHTFDCGGNELVSLPSMVFPNLHTFQCYNNKLVSLPENMVFPKLHTFNCSMNRLVSIPNMVFPNLHTFKCSFNSLVSLPIMNFPNLHTFNCSENKLVSLPNMVFPKLHTFNCGSNKLVSLPSMVFPNLHNFHCNNNKLVSLPSMVFPNMHTFHCYGNELVLLPSMICPNMNTFGCHGNKLVTLPENMNFPNMHTFNCSNNILVSLPVCILNFRNMVHFVYHNNEIELSPQIARFINMIRNKPIKQLSVYNDTQNVHNASIQLSTRDSINRLTCRTDIDKYNKDILHSIILENNTLTEKSKQLLYEYIEDDTIHSLLLLTFSEVLWYTLQTIITDFDMSTQKQIYHIMNQELMDTECKCFTGRICRIINCLYGFSELVVICINESEQIGNIIVMVRNKLYSYTVEKHKEEVKKELLERGYNDSVIDLWLQYIE